jgi:hypothetical protein
LQRIPPTPNLLSIVEKNIKGDFSGKPGWFWSRSKSLRYS